MSSRKTVENMCKNPEDFYGSRFDYGSNLIMIKSPSSQSANDTFIYCFTLNEIKTILNDKEQRFYRHHEYEVKHYRGIDFVNINDEENDYLTSEQRNEVRSFNEESRRNKEKWIYNIPYISAYVDYSFMKCIEDGKNSIVLVQHPEPIYIFKSFGRSGNKDLKIYLCSAYPIARCEMIEPFLNENEKANCDDTSTFDEEKEKEIKESIPENEVENEVENEEKKRKVEEYILETRRKMEEIKRSRGGDSIDYIGDYRQETKVYPDGKKIINRYFGEEDYDFYDENIPTFESERKDENETKILKWYKNGNLHRETGPAFITIQKGFVKSETWYKNGKINREDGPALTMYYPKSKKIYEHAWLRDGLPILESPARKIYYFNDTNSIMFEITISKDGIKNVKSYYENGNLFYSQNGNNIILHKNANHSPEMGIVKYDEQQKTIRFESMIGNIQKNVEISREKCLIKYTSNDIRMKEIDFKPNLGDISLKVFINNELKILKTLRIFYKQNEGTALKRNYLLNNNTQPTSQDSDDIKNRNETYAVQVWYPNGVQKEIVSYVKGVITNPRVGSLKRWYPNGKMHLNLFKFNQEGNFPFKNNDICIIKYEPKSIGQKALDEKGNMISIKLIPDTKDTIDEKNDLIEFKPDLSIIKKRDEFDKNFIEFEMGVINTLLFLISDSIRNDDTEMFRYLRILNEEYISNMPPEIVKRIRGDYPEYDIDYLGFGNNFQK